MKLYKKTRNNNLRNIEILGIKFSYKIKKNQQNFTKETQDDSLKVYDENFFRGQAESSYRSAKEILNVVTKIITKVESVADVGCGVGTWLKAWRDKDDSIEILGFDCNELDESYLYVPRKFIKFFDFTKSIKTEISKKFSIVNSLEFAEHLQPEYADSLVNFLTTLSDVVLFSAAAPNQTGTNHFNENTPQYWADIFLKYGYSCYDSIRKDIWNNKNISWWYRQNILLFIKDDSEAFKHIDKRNLGEKSIPNLYYHPELLRMYVR